MNNKELHVNRKHPSFQIAQKAISIATNLPMAASAARCEEAIKSIAKNPGSIPVPKDLFEVPEDKKDKNPKK